MISERSGMRDQHILLDSMSMRYLLPLVAPEYASMTQELKSSLVGGVILCGVFPSSLKPLA